MGITDKIKNFIAPVEPDDEDLELTEEEAQAISGYEEPNQKGISRVTSDTKMVLFEPRSFEETEDIARHLKGKRAAVINLHRLQREYAQRTIDFLTGVVFALDGTIQKIGHNVILCSPKNIPVQGEITLESTDE